MSGDSLCIQLVDTLIRQIEVHHNAHILVFIESETAGLYENGNQSHAAYALVHLTPWEK